MARELAAKGESEDRQLDCYRKIRDEIRAFIEKLPENINK
jgi:arsenate reductase